MVEITINIEKCNGCGDCVNACLYGVLKVQDGKCSVNRLDACRFDMICVARCPNKAITIRV
ncbi:MAG: 4Fe-4S binding protein [Methanosarcinales archaeon]